MNDEAILVVDDDAGVREGLRRILAERGYATDTASTAEEALIILAHKPFDLVITDLQMPGMDGLALLDEIKRRSQHTPVIVITAYGSMETVIHALRSGVSDFVTKPFRPDELLNIVSREVTRHKRAAPAGAPAGLGRQFASQQLDEIDHLLAELRAETGARCLLLVESNGYVIDTKGAIENINVSALAALVSGDFAATAGIASLIGEGESFRLNYHEGKRYSVYSAQVVPDVFLLVVFGQEARSGMVLYYTRQMLPRLQEIIERATPGPVREAGAPPEPGAVFSLEEIQSSGLLDEDVLAALDDQFANLWAADAG